MYIAFASEKGGVGKTVVALHVAYALAQKKKTALIDADSIKASTNWNARSGGELGVPIFNEKQAVRIGGQYEHLIFDCPGRASDEELKDLALACDWLICPVPLDALNLDAALSLGETFGRLGIKNYRFLLNRATTKAATEARDLLTQASYPVLATAIRDSAAFRHAAALGVTVDRVPAHLSATAGDAWGDIQNLTKELMKL